MPTPDPGGASSPARHPSPKLQVHIVASASSPPHSRAASPSTAAIQPITQQRFAVAAMIMNESPRKSMRNGTTTMRNQQQQQHQLQQQKQAPHRLLVRAADGITTRDLFVLPVPPYTLHSTHPLKLVWNTLRLIGLLFYAILCPLRLCIVDQHQYQPTILIDYLLVDVFFACTLLAHLLCFLPSHIEELKYRKEIAIEYISGRTTSRFRVACDVLATIPLDLIGYAWINSNPQSYIVVYALRMLKLLHLSSTFELVEALPTHLPTWKELTTAQSSANGNGQNIPGSRRGSLSMSMQSPRNLVGLESVIMTRRDLFKTKPPAATAASNPSTPTSSSSSSSSTDSTGLSLSTLRSLGLKPIWKIVALYVFLIHLYACLWALLTKTSRVNTRIGETLPPQERYMEAIYFVVVVLACVGYGDVTPETSGEVLLTMLIELSGFLCIGGIIAYTVPLFTQANVNDLRQQDCETEWCEVFNEHGISEETRERILGYYRFVYERQKGGEVQKEKMRMHGRGMNADDSDDPTSSSSSSILLSNQHLIPQRYRMELGMHIFGKILITLPFLCVPIEDDEEEKENRDASSFIPLSPSPPPRVFGAPVGLLRAMILRMSSSIYTTGDIILFCGQRNDRLYVIAKGDVARVKLERVTEEQQKEQQQDGSDPQQCSNDTVLETSVKLTCGYFGIETFLHPEYLVEADYQVIDVQQNEWELKEEAKRKEEEEMMKKGNEDGTGIAVRSVSKKILGTASSSHHHSRDTSSSSSATSFAASCRPLTHASFLGRATRSNYADIFTLSRKDYSQLARPYPGFTLEEVQVRWKEEEEKEARRIEWLNQAAIQKNTSATAAGTAATLHHLKKFSSAPASSPTITLPTSTSPPQPRVTRTLSSFLRANPLAAVGADVQAELAKHAELQGLQISHFQAMSSAQQSPRSDIQIASSGPQTPTGNQQPAAGKILSIFPSGSPTSKRQSLGGGNNGNGSTTSCSTPSTPSSSSADRAGHLKKAIADREKLLAEVAEAEAEESEEEDGEVEGEGKKTKGENDTTPGAPTETDAVTTTADGTLPSNKKKHKSKHSHSSTPAPSTPSFFRLLFLSPHTLIDTTSLFRRIWDILLLISLLYIYIVIPLQAAFLNQELVLGEKAIPIELVIEKQSSKGTTERVQYFRLQENSTMSDSSSSSRIMNTAEWIWLGLSWCVDLIFLMDIYFRLCKFKNARSGSLNTTHANSTAGTVTTAPSLAGTPRGGDGGKVKPHRASLLEQLSSPSPHITPTLDHNDDDDDSTSQNDDDLTLRSARVKQRLRDEHAEAAAQELENTLQKRVRITTQIQEQLREQIREFRSDYIKTWRFFFDILAIFPLELLIPLSVGGISTQWLYFFRLNRLLRLHRSGELIHKFEGEVVEWMRNGGGTQAAAGGASSPTTSTTSTASSSRFPFFTKYLTMFKILFCALLFCHIIGCAWFLLSYILTTWYNYEDQTWIWSDGVINSSFSHQYVRSFFFVLVTCSSIGYGGIVPRCNVEMIFVVVLIILGVSMYITLLASLTVSAEQRNSSSHEHSQYIQILRQYFRTRSVDYKIREKVMRYYNSQASMILMKCQKEDRLMNELPPLLKIEFLAPLLAYSFMNLPLFNDFSSEFLDMLLSQLEARTYVSNDIISRLNERSRITYFIYRGTVEVRVLIAGMMRTIKTLQPEESFGSECLLYSIPPERPASYTAAQGICNVFLLNKVHFDKLLDTFPGDAELMQIKRKHVEEMFGGGGGGNGDDASSSPAQPESRRTLLNRAMGASPLDIRAQQHRTGPSRVQEEAETSHLSRVSAMQGHDVTRDEGYTDGCASDGEGGDEEDEEDDDDSDDSDSDDDNPLDLHMQQQDEPSALRRQLPLSRQGSRVSRNSLVFAHKQNRASGGGKRSSVGGIGGGSEDTMPSPTSRQFSVPLGLKPKSVARSSHSSLLAGALSMILAKQQAQQAAEAAALASAAASSVENSNNSIPSPSLATVRTIDPSHSPDSSVVMEPYTGGGNGNGGIDASITGNMTIELTPMPPSSPSYLMEPLTPLTPFPSIEQSPSPPPPPHNPPEIPAPDDTNEQEVNPSNNDFKQALFDEDDLKQNENSVSQSIVAPLKPIFTSPPVEKGGLRKIRLDRAKSVLNGDKEKDSTLAKALSEAGTKVSDSTNITGGATFRSADEFGGGVTSDASPPTQHHPQLKPRGASHSFTRQGTSKSFRGGLGGAGGASLPRAASVNRVGSFGKKNSPNTAKVADMPLEEQQQEEKSPPQGIQRTITFQKTHGRSNSFGVGANNGAAEFAVGRKSSFKNGAIGGNSSASNGGVAGTIAGMGIGVKRHRSVAARSSSSSEDASSSASPPNLPRATTRAPTLRSAISSAGTSSVGAASSSIAGASDVTARLQRHQAAAARMGTWNRSDTNNQSGVALSRAITRVHTIGSGLFDDPDAVSVGAVGGLPTSPQQQHSRRGMSSRSRTTSMGRVSTSHRAQSTSLFGMRRLMTRTSTAGRSTYQVNGRTRTLTKSMLRGESLAQLVTEDGESISLHLLPNSLFRNIWSFLGACALLYYLFIIPWRIAFDAPLKHTWSPSVAVEIQNGVSGVTQDSGNSFDNTDWSLHPSIYLDCLCDIFFLFDMLLHFNYFSYYDSSTGMLVTGPREKIRENYVRGNGKGSEVWYDVMGTFILDFLVLAICKNSLGVWILYWLRIFRLVRLHRVMEYLDVTYAFLEDLPQMVGMMCGSGSGCCGKSKNSNHANATTNSSSSLGKNLSLINILFQWVLITIIFHWLACLWYLIGLSDDTEMGWLAQYDAPVYSMNTHDASIASRASFSTSSPISVHLSQSYTYSLCLYYIVVTMSTVGYGDIQPHTPLETWFTIFTIFLGLVIYASVTANIASLAANFDVTIGAFQKEFDLMKDYSQRKNLTPELKKKIYSYFSDMWVQFKGKSEEEILGSLPLLLREEIAHSLYGELLMQSGLFIGNANVNNNGGSAATATSGATADSKGASSSSATPLPSTLPAPIPSIFRDPFLRALSSLLIYRSYTDGEIIYRKDEYIDYALFVKFGAVDAFELKQINPAFLAAAAQHAREGLATMHVGHHAPAGGNIGVGSTPRASIDASSAPAISHSEEATYALTHKESLVHRYTKNAVINPEVLLYSTATAVGVGMKEKKEKGHHRTPSYEAAAALAAAAAEQQAQQQSQQHPTILLPPIPLKQTRTLRASQTLICLQLPSASLHSLLLLYPQVVSTLHKNIIGQKSSKIGLVRVQGNTLSMMATARKVQARKDEQVRQLMLQSVKAPPGGGKGHRRQRSRPMATESGEIDAAEKDLGTATMRGRKKKQASDGGTSSDDDDDDDNTPQAEHDRDEVNRALETVRQSVLEAEAKEASQSYGIISRDSSFRLKWDLFALLFVLLYLFSIPILVAFSSSSSLQSALPWSHSFTDPDMFWPILVVTYVFDIFFGFDFYLHLRRFAQRQNGESEGREEEESGGSGGGRGGSDGDGTTAGNEGLSATSVLGLESLRASAGDGLFTLRSMKNRHSQRHGTRGSLTGLSLNKVQLSSSDITHDYLFTRSHGLVKTLIEAISGMPWDIFALIVAACTNSPFITMQFVALLRLGRLLYVARLPTYLESLDLFLEQSKLSLNFQVQRIMKLSLLIIIVLHWMSCGWYLLGRYPWQGNGVDIRNSSAYKQVDADSGEVISWLTSGYKSSIFLHSSSFSQYLWSLYWAISTITTTGMGDISATNQGELLLNMFMILTGDIVYGMIIGGICVNASNSHQPIAVYSNHIMNIISYMRYYDIPQSIQNRLLVYHGYIWKQTRGKDIHDSYIIQNQLPFYLGRECQYSIYSSLLKSVPFFQSCSSLFLSHISMILRERIFLTKECVYRQGDVGENMFILKSGEMRVAIRNNNGSASSGAAAGIGGGGGGAFFPSSPSHSSSNDMKYIHLDAPSIFGEVSFFMGTTRSAHISALVPSLVLELNRTRFEEVLNSFPGVRKNIMEKFVLNIYPDIKARLKNKAKHAAWNDAPVQQQQQQQTQQQQHTPPEQHDGSATEKPTPQQADPLGYLVKHLMKADMNGQPDSNDASPAFRAAKGPKNGEDECEEVDLLQNDFSSNNGRLSRIESEMASNTSMQPHAQRHHAHNRSSLNIDISEAKRLGAALMNVQEDSHSMLLPAANSSSVTSTTLNTALNQPRSDAPVPKSPQSAHTPVATYLDSSLPVLALSIPTHRVSIVSEMTSELSSQQEKRDEESTSAVPASVLASASEPVFQGEVSLPVSLPPVESTLAATSTPTTFMISPRNNRVVTPPSPPTAGSATASSSIVPSSATSPVQRTHRLTFTRNTSVMPAVMMTTLTTSVSPRSTIGGGVQQSQQQTQPQQPAIIISPRATRNTTIAHIDPVPASTTTPMSPMNASSTTRIPLRITLKPKSNTNI